MVRPARFSLGMGRAKLTPGFEVEQVRRAAAMAFLAGGVAACGGTQRPVSAPRPEPGAVVSTLFDAGSVYGAMGLLVAGPPLPFVATLDYVADATPDSTLAVFGLSLSNHALTFQRDGNVFTAHYHVEVTFRADEIGRASCRE